MKNRNSTADYKSHLRDNVLDMLGRDPTAGCGMVNIPGLEAAFIMFIIPLTGEVPGNLGPDWPGVL